MKDSQRRAIHAKKKNKFVMGGKHRFNNLTTEQKKRYKELYG